MKIKDFVQGMSDEQIEEALLGKVLKRYDAERNFTFEFEVTKVRLPSRKEDRDISFDFRKLNGPNRGEEGNVFLLWLEDDSCDWSIDANS